MMGGTQHSGYYSPQQIGRMHRSLATYGVRKYAWGYSPTPYTVVNNESWDFNIKLYQDLVIPAGTTLTVKCVVEMVPQAKVVVRPGGKLIIDGGKFTAAQFSHSFWSGIDIWGDNTHNQFPSNQPTYQGMLVLKNDAIIEHAREINVRGPSWGSFGGVIQATDAHFINCRRAGQFLSYQNTSPGGAPMANRSFFTRCEFKVDDQYRGGNDFYAHVSMWDVNGIRFNQCEFKNEQTSITESDFLGCGILSLDAGYSVSGWCDDGITTVCEPGTVIPPCPEGQLYPTRFIGLDHGIHALSSGANGRTFTVNGCSFENNICGVYTTGVNNFKIHRSTFTVGGRNVTLTGDVDGEFQGRHRAIYNYGGNGFSVQENAFSKDFGAQLLLEVEGTVMGYTGPYNDMVYNNRAGGMDHSFVAEGSCYDQNNGTVTGLQFICDDAAQNGARDFVVRIPFDGTPGQQNSIRQFQGSTTLSAGNEFTAGQQGAYSFYNYDNEAQGVPITYFWQQGAGGVPEPGAYNYPWVIFNPNPGYDSPAHTCPSRIICPGTGHQVRTTLADELETEKLAYLNLKYVFESLLDGGDYDELRETIMSSWPTDAWELRNGLMARSPYLSVDILRDAATRDILPDAMMLEVCLANPEATKRDGFDKWIEFNAPNPLPHYMVEQIWASWDERSFRTSLESNMGMRLAEWGRLNDEVIGALRNDTLPEPVDSILVRWQMNRALGARFGEAQTLMELGRFNEAEALMTALPDDYRMRALELEERADMLALIGVYRAANIASTDLFHLSMTQQSELVTLAEGQPTRAAIWAQNLLCFAYSQCTSPVTGGSMPVRSAVISTEAQSASKAHLALRVYPSPASTWITFETALPETSERPQIVVRDVSGREVVRMSVPVGQGQQVWDVRERAAGTYSAELTADGAVIASERFVVRP